MNGNASNLFLITSTDIESNGIGAIFIKSLFAESGEFNLICYIRPPFILNDRMFSKARLFRYIKSIYVRIGLLQSLRLFVYRKFFLNRECSLLVKQLSALGLSKVWVTASSPEVIWLAELLALDGFDVRVMVWDAPEYLSKNLRIVGRCKYLLCSSFENLIKLARRVSVISLNMRNDYLRNYGVDSLVIRHGVEFEHKLRRMSTDGDINVVFAGNLYSKSEWNAFVEAMSSVGWVVGGRNIKLYFIGRFPLGGASRPSHITVLGEKSFHDTLEIMSKMDIGYLPYWLSKEHEIAARTSFPGKVSAYAAAGLAIFHHGPRYAELASFLDTFPFGVTCSSLDFDDIIKSVEKLTDLASGDDCVEARRLAFNMELSRKSMYGRFKSFVNGTYGE